MSDPTIDDINRVELDLLERIRELTCKMQELETRVQELERINDRRDEVERYIQETR